MDVMIELTRVKDGGGEKDSFSRESPNLEPGTNQTEGGSASTSSSASRKKDRKRERTTAP